MTLTPALAAFLKDRYDLATYSEWWVIISITAPNGSTVTFNLSLRGTRNNISAVTSGGYTIPAHQQFPKRVLTVPSITQSMWRDGAILSDSLPTFGPLVLNNADRYFDQFHPKEGYTWSGGTIVVFFMNSKDRFTVPATITKVVEAHLGQPQYSMSHELTIPVIGMEGIFNKPLSNRVYRGTSYQLELSGDRTVSYGTPSAVDIRTSLTLECWKWVEALPAADQTFWGWLDGTATPWRVIIKTTGTINLQATIGGSLQTVIPTTITMGLGVPYHLSIVVSGRNVIFYLWNDDTQQLLTETISNAFTSSTRDLHSGSTYKLSSRSDARYKPWFDEMRVWSVARTLTEITADRSRPLLTGNIPITCVHRCGMDDGTGTTVTDSSATVANGTISGAGSSTWLWALEGGPELAGTPKPDTIGKKFGCKPVLVDPIRNKYQVHWGSVNSIQSHEGGNPLTMDANAAGMRAFMTTTPASGHSLPYLARGYFSFPATAAVLPVSANVNGADDGSLGYVETASKVSRYLASRRAGISDPSGIDTTSFTLFETTFNPTVGFTNYNGGGSGNNGSGTIHDALSNVMKSSLSWWGYLRGSTLFRIQKFTVPGLTSTRTFKGMVEVGGQIFDIQEISNNTIIYEVEVRYHYNDVVMNEGQVASGVKSTANWTQWTRPYLYKIATDQTLKDKYEGKEGKRLVIESLLYNDADAQQLANDTLAIVKGFHQSLRVTLTLSGYDGVLGDTESIDYRYQGGQTVLGLDGNDRMVLITTIDNLQNGQIVHDLYGGEGL